MRPSWIENIRNHQDRNRIDGIALDHYRWYLDYHYRAMDARRSIQVKVFTGLVIVDLALLKGASDVLMGPAGSQDVRILVEIIFGILFLVFFGFILQVEYANRRNREMYHRLEARLLAHLAKEEISHVAPAQERWWQTILISWAGTWTVIASFTLFVISVALVEHVPLNANVDTARQQLNMKQRVQPSTEAQQPVPGRRPQAGAPEPGRWATKESPRRIVQQ